MNKKFFKVADHVFCVEACDELLSQMDNYSPFAVSSSDACCEKPVFSLVVQEAVAPEFTEEARQEDEGQSIVCGRTAEGLPVFDFWLLDKSTGVLVCEKDFKHAVLFLGEKGNGANAASAAIAGMRQFALNNALMVLYALATAGLGTALFHAASVSYKGLGYLFLGKSGTGKSTHARLWLKYIEGTELFNDDNPVVRLFEKDGRKFAVAYGSPWSGKTPCYKNVKFELGGFVLLSVKFELGGFVLLSQAPFNKITPLKGVSAYAAILPSISGMRWDREIADGLHMTQNGLASNVPVWYLECLPDENAARLCSQTIAREIQ